MITVSISLPEELVNKIDFERKDIGRSKYVSRLLQKAYENQDSSK